MFQIRDVTGTHRPYIPGEVRQSRRIDAAAPLLSAKAVESGESHGDDAIKAVARRYRGEEGEQQREEIRFVREIMTSPVKTATMDAHMSDVSQLFLAKRFRHLPIVSSTNSLVGIVSDRDVLRFSARASTDGHNLKTAAVSTIMTTDILTASPEALIRDVARVLFEERIGSMPVLAEDSSLVGIVTRSDILRALLRHGPMNLWA